MVSGDIINGIFTTLGVDHFVQPAANVEIIITFPGGRGSNTFSGLYDGVTVSNCRISNNTVFAESNQRIGITNTNYLLCNADLSPPSYSGIQIK